jgi:glycine C-acetyltransferase/8-amino-7-oxononanoate synthase
MSGLLQMQSPLGARMRIAGREVDYFCGTSYHALHGHPEVIEAACDATRRFGLGPGTLAGMEVYERLQEALCDWFGAAHVTLTSSGYAAPMAMLQGLKDDFDLVLVDAATHYSARDALPTLDRPVHTFRHLSPESLAETLARHVGPGQRPAVMTDGVFPSGGAIAPLAAYRDALARYDGALLCVDDSHGLGILGADGRGTLQHEGVEGPGSFVSGTLSKAFGASGGIVPGDAALAAKIGANALVLRGASPPPPAAAAAALTAMRLLRTQPEMRKRLANNVRRMRSGLRDLGFELPDTPVPIVTIREGRHDFTALQAALDRRDIVVKLTPARGYSDAPDEATLRIAVFSTHQPDQIDRLLSAMAELL